MSNPASNTAVVFDFGGVLMDWNPYYLYRKYLGDDREIERFLDEIGFHDWNVRMDGGRPFSTSVAELSLKYPQYTGLIRVFDERWEETNGGPIEGTVEILRDLKEARYPLYALSNWSAEKFRIVRRKYGFFDWFEAIVLSGEERLVKPDPAIFRVLLQRIDRRAQECLFIDDSPANTEVAGKLGFRTIHFQSPGQLRKALGQYGIRPAPGQ